MSSEHHKEAVLPFDQELGALTILDVRIQPIPFHDFAGLLSQRNRPPHEPSVCAVVSSVAAFVFAWRSSFQWRLPVLKDTRVIIRMDGLLPATLKRFRHADTREIAPSLVKEVDGAVGCCAPHIAGYGVDHRPKLALGSPQFA